MNVDSCSLNRPMMNFSMIDDAILGLWIGRELLIVFYDAVAMFPSYISRLTNLSQSPAAEIVVVKPEDPSTILIFLIDILLSGTIEI